MFNFTYTSISFSWLQLPAARRHSGVFELGHQLLAHLARDSWPLGKGVLEAQVWMEGVMDSLFLEDPGEVRLWKGPQSEG